MHLTLDVKSADPEKKRHREALAQRVLDCLQGRPDRRLLCFLDDEDWKAFKQVCGAAHRGFYSPIILTERFWQWAPNYIWEIVNPGELAFDDLVYLHGSTCSCGVGLAMTLAHELQHFLQHSEQTQLWAANSLVPRLPKTALRALELRWCDIPLEREARIVSKRTAEQVFGAELVRQYIDHKIADRETDDDASDWQCVQGLAALAPYNLAEETRLFFPRLKGYRRELEQVLRDFQAENPDFLAVDLGALLSGADR
jgi:hypothetical protein